MTTTEWILRDREHARTFAVARGPEIIVIGRGSEAHIALDDDPFVSTRHAALVETAEGPMLVDLDSLNGTKLNGAPVLPDRAVPLRSGDVIRVGHTEVVFGGD